MGMPRRSGSLVAIVIALAACKPPVAPQPVAPARGRDPVVAHDEASTPTVTRPWRARLADGRAAIRIPDAAPTRGASTPLVTAVLFGDFTDPDSAVAASALATARERWPDDLRVAFVQFPNPMRPIARMAAETAIFAGGRDGFWKMHDRLFATPPTDRRALQAAVVELGLDTAAWNAALDGKLHRGWLNADADAARELGVTRAGTLFVNGRLAPRDAEGIVATIAGERDDMAELVRGGMPREAVYAEILAVTAPPAAATAVVDPASPDPRINYAVPAHDRPVRGPVDARVTIVAFLDFQCPFCARVQSTLDDVLRAHPDDVRIVFRNLPLAFHKDARTLAKIALAAERKGKFWEMQALLFARKELGAANWKPLAKRLRLRPAELEAIAARPEIERTIAEDELIAAAVGASGTPTFFVNGRLLSGAQPLDSFEALIDEELAKADEFAAHDPGGGGTFYDRLIVGFAPPFRSPPPEIFFD